MDAPRKKINIDDNTQILLKNYLKSDQSSPQGRRSFLKTTVGLGILTISGSWLIRKASAKEIVHSPNKVLKAKRNESAKNSYIYDDDTDCGKCCVDECRKECAEPCVECACKKCLDCKCTVAIEEDGMDHREAYEDVKIGTPFYTDDADNTNTIDNDLAETAQSTNYKEMHNAKDIYDNDDNYIGSWDVGNLPE